MVGGLLVERGCFVRRWVVMWWRWWGLGDGCLVMGYLVVGRCIFDYVINLLFYLMMKVVRDRESFFYFRFLSCVHFSYLFNI